MAIMRKYIILGSGIAGMAAAEAIREGDPAAQILMISAEKELCFNRPMLISEFALDGSGAVLFEKQQGWPAQFNVETRLGIEAEAIDAAAHLVRLSDGTEEKYDKLIYALGAEVTIPPIPGADRNNVYVVRTRDDMRQIRQAMKEAKHAVVIGGGMLGLEDAWGLYEEKLEVAVIEQNQRVAFGQIDQSAGNLMKKRIERMGVPVYLNATVTEITEDAVCFSQPEEDGPGTEQKSVPADLVILSTGVTPGSGLGEAAGLKVTGKPGTGGGADTADIAEAAGDIKEPGRRWIFVDDQCRTSDPDIFAAGDCAAVNGRNDAIWDEAREMGRVAGSNAVQAYYPDREVQVYRPVTAQHVFTGFDTEVFTMGDSSGAGTDGVYIRHADVEIFDYQRERYIRVSLDKGIIAGILLINASELAPELMEAYQEGAGEDEAREIILRWRENHEVDFKPAAPFKHRGYPTK